jgi:Arc/MetJ-type ribon-helix-helix transcriptional regulator
MRSTSIKLPETTDETLTEYAEENHDGNRSEAIRALLDKGLRYDERVTEIERLKRELRAANARQEEHTELVEYVEQERSIQQRREERRDAPLWRRAKWFVFGRSSE